MKTFPEGISIDICFSCNNNCIFCVNNESKSKDKDLPLSKVKNMILEVRSFFDGIIINGGEPTIREDIVEIIKFAKKLRFKAIMMISNGRMFSYKRFSKILTKSGLSLVFVTLQASNAELHDKQTRVKGSFQQAIEGIKNLKKLGVEVHTNTVINGLNFRDLSKMPFLLSSLGVSFSKISYMRLKGIAEKNMDWLGIRMSKLVPYIKLSARNFMELKKDFIIQEIPPCVMKCFVKYIRKGPKMPNIDDGGQNNSASFMKKYFRGGNIKRKNCSKCIYYHECLGPWEEYVKYFGWDEFSPIKDKNVN